MNDRQSRTLDMFQVIARKLRGLRLDAPPPLYLQMRTRLDETIGRILALKADQRSGAMAMTGQTITHLKARVRRKQMLPLARMARPLLKFAPGEAAILKLPHARADARTIGTHGLAMVKALKPHRKLLASAGYIDILAELERDAASLVKGDMRAQKGRSLRSRATRDMARQFKQAAETVQVLDSLLMVHGPESFQAPWATLKTLGKKIGRPRKSRRRKAPPRPIS